MTSRFAPGRAARRGLLCLALAALAPAAARTEGTNEVGIDNFTFSPNVLTIAPGTEVTWTNHDDIPHSIVIPSIQARSKAIDTDKEFTFKFDKAGNFAYICGLHPHMQGKIVVK